jgi:beta-lactamase class D
MFRLSPAWCLVVDVVDGGGWEVGLEFLSLNWFVGWVSLGLQQISVFEDNFDLDMFFE